MATLKLAIDARSLLATVTRVERGLAGISSAAEKTFSRMKSAANIALGPLKAMIALSVTMKTAMIATGMASIGAAGDYEMFNQQLRAVIATKKQADLAFKESMELSVRTPFTPDEIIQTRVELEAVGVRGVKAIEQVATAAAAMNAEIGNVASAIKSMETEPLRRLGIQLKRNGEEFLFQFRNKVGQAQTISVKGFEQAQAALLSIFETKYAGGLEKMSLTWQGLISTLKGTVKDLRAEFGAGFLDESKLLVNDLIEASKQLKKSAGEAGRTFGDEMMIARAHLLAGFDTALKVAEQIKDAMKQEGGAGSVVLEAFRLGTTLLTDAVVTAFEISLPLWKTIGTIVGQGIIDALMQSNIPGSGFAREMAIGLNLKNKPYAELAGMAEQYNVPTETVLPWQVKWAWEDKEFEKRKKTVNELASDLAAEIKKLSVEEQIAFAEFDPAATIANSIEQSRQKISDAMQAMGAETVAQLQQFENNLAGATGKEAIDLMEDFKQNLQIRLGEGEELIKQWREKLDAQAEAAPSVASGGGYGTPSTPIGVFGPPEFTEAEKKQRLEDARDFAHKRADITARMYDDIGQLGTGYYESQKDLLEYEKQDYGEFVKDKALLDEWYSSKLAKISVESSGFWLEVRDATQAAQSALSDYFMEFGNLDDLLTSTEKAFQRMFANLAAQMAMFGVMSALFSSPGALGFANPMANFGNAGFGGGWLFGGPKAPTYVPHRLGGVVGNGRVVPMASGMVLDGTTYFPMADGNIGKAGEAGPELGFFPLKRQGGKLGVEASGQQPVVVNPAPVRVIYVKNEREAMIEAMLSDEGQQAIVLANR